VNETKLYFLHLQLHVQPQ